MSGKIRLGKTRDSRTRKQAVKPINIEEAEALEKELSEQTEFAQYLLFKGYSTSTARRYIKDAMLFIEWSEKENVPIEQVSYSDVLHYIQSKKSKVKQKTVSTNINSIKHYFNFLAVTDQQIENPTTQIQIKGVKRKMLYDILSKKELESLFNNFEIPNEETSKNKNQNWFYTSQLASKRNKVILGLMIYQGLGTTELSRLTEKDLNLREGQLFIVGTRKSNERKMKLEAHQILDIMEYTLQVRQLILKLSNKETTAQLFVSTGTSAYFRSIINKLIKKLKKQNSKVTSVFQIKTSVITHWLKIHNLRQVQYMAGHRYVSSTEAYFVNDLDDLSEDISKFHPMG